MKVISLQQPFATLMVIGAKKVETRSWNTTHRGPLLIHASKGFPAQYKALCSQEPFCDFIRNWEELPLGGIIGMVTLKGTGPTNRFTTMDGSLAVIKIPSLAQELAFGDYGPNRYGWYCEEPVRFDKPIPAKGQLGLWEFPDELIKGAEWHRKNPL